MKIDYVAWAAMFIALVGLFWNVNTDFNRVHERMDRLQVETNRRFDTVQTEMNQMRAEMNRRFDTMQAENQRQHDAMEEVLRIFFLQGGHRPESALAELHDIAGIDVFIPPGMWAEARLQSQIIWTQIGDDLGPTMDNLRPLQVGCLAPAWRNLGYKPCDNAWETLGGKQGWPWRINRYRHSRTVRG